MCTVSVCVFKLLLAYRVDNFTENTSSNSKTCTAAAPKLT